MVWPTTNPTYGTYQWLRLGVAMYLDYPLDDDAADTQQSSLVDFIVQRGVRLFYNPPVPPAKDGSVFSWSFLNIREAMAQVSGQIEYDLGGNLSAGWTVAGRLNWATMSFEQGYRKMEIVSEEEIMALYGKAAGGSAPAGNAQYCAIRPKAEAGSEDVTAAQTWEVIVYPEPNSNESMTFRYRVHPPVLTTTNDYPIANIEHAETIMCACLSIAEMTKTRASGPMHERFMQQLQASMAIDMSLVQKARNDPFFAERPRP